MMKTTNVFVMKVSKKAILTTTYEFVKVKQFKHYIVCTIKVFVYVPLEL